MCALCPAAPRRYGVTSDSANPATVRRARLWCGPHVAAAPKHRHSLRYTSCTPLPPLDRCMRSTIRAPSSRAAATGLGRIPTLALDPATLAAATIWRSATGERVCIPGPTRARTCHSRGKANGRRHRRHAACRPARSRQARQAGPVLRPDSSRKKPGPCLGQTVGPVWVQSTDKNAVCRPRSSLADWRRTRNPDFISNHLIIFGLVAEMDAKASRGRKRWRLGKERAGAPSGRLLAACPVAAWRACWALCSCADRAQASASARCSHLIGPCACQ